MSPSTAILIAGPTASGKSALAIKLARERDGVILNADSMQVYSELDILSARPSAQDLAEVPHRLYGHQPLRDGYSAGRFFREAERMLAEVRSEGRLPIFVGGTGLYMKILLEGLSPVPEIPPEIRTHWRAEAVRLGPHSLHARLMEMDPATAALLRPSDPQRIVRALEVLEATGRPLSEWQREPGRPLVHAGETECLLLLPDRAVLWERSDARFDRMMARGALAEAERILALQLDPALPGMRALGLRPLMAHIRGEVPLEAAVMAGKEETRRYIKRQETWAAGNMKSWRRLSSQ